MVEATMRKAVGDKTVKLFFNQLQEKTGERTYVCRIIHFISNI